MNTLYIFFAKHKSYAVWLFLITLITLISFKEYLYDFSILITKSVGWSYVFDQSLPLITACIVLFIVTKNNLGKIKKNVKKHIPSLLVLGVVTLLVHGILLNTYFYAEDSNYVMIPILNNYPLSSIMIGYPLLPFVLSVLLFKTNVYLYNIFSLILLSTSAFLFYWLVNTLTKKKIIALVSSLIYITTPSYLIAFPWQVLAQGTPFVFSVGLISILCLIYYQKNLKNTFYILSILFFIACLKAGFVRSAGIVCVVGFICFFPFQKLKIEIKKGFIQFIPFVLIWWSYLWFEFISKSSGFLQKNSSGVSIHNYLNSVSYFITTLFFPSSWGKFSFPILTALNIRVISYAYVIGLILIVFLVFLVFASLLKRKSKYSWVVIFSIVIIFSNIFYIPFFQNVPINTQTFDQMFILSSPPYGPGSRYLVFSAMGMGLLISLLYYKIFKKGTLVGLLSSILVGGLICLNGYLTFTTHKEFIDSEERQTKNLMENFMKVVPRDGKPKLIFSENPVFGPIDVNPGIYGFYKLNENYYTRDRNELLVLVKSKYKDKNNFYSFYYNPDTQVFTNTTLETRKKLFENSDKLASREVPVEFMANLSKSKQEEVNGSITAIEPSVLFSKKIGERDLFPKVLSLNFEIDKLYPSNFPSSFGVYDSDINGISKIWKAFLPKSRLDLVSKKDALLLSQYLTSQFSKEDMNKIADIEKEREELRQGSTVLVSGIGDTDQRVNSNSLIDGKYTSAPSIGENERFFIADKTPSIITVNLPRPIQLGRLILDIPLIYVGEHSPTKMTILGSLNGGGLEQVGSYGIGALVKGRKIVNPLTPKLSDSIQIIVSKTSGKPVSLDEIIIDSKEAVSYSDEQISMYVDKAMLFVDSKELYDKLIDTQLYNYMTFVYTCAEEKDWKSQEISDTIIPSVWHFKSVNFNLGLENQLEIPVDCNGSILQQIGLIGPHFPSSLKLNSASLK